MPIQFSNPQGLMVPTSYSQLAIVIPQRTVYIAGQIALDQTGQLIGRDDFLRQTQQVYANLQLALTSVGAGFDQVIKTTIYVVDSNPEKLRMVSQVRRHFHLGPHLPASTYVGVERLAIEGLLLEIEAIAVLD